MLPPSPRLLLPPSMCKRCSVLLRNKIATDRLGPTKPPSSQYSQSRLHPAPAVARMDLYTACSGGMVMSCALHRRIGTAEMHCLLALLFLSQRPSDHAVTEWSYGKWQGA